MPSRIKNVYALYATLLDLAIFEIFKNASGVFTIGYG